MKRKPWYIWSSPHRPHRLNRPHRSHKLHQPHQSRRSRRAVKGFVFLMVLTTAMLFMAAGYYQFDRTVMPLALKAADLRLKTAINEALDSTLRQVISERGVTANDFYIRTTEADGASPVLAVNTLLINDICNAAALDISRQLSSLENEKVTVPVSATLRLDTLAHTGPQFIFNMYPIGNAQVNYTSKMDASGINQVHFEVYLTVESTISIINPVQTATVTVTRDIALVDTVIIGEVPDAYVNMERQLSQP